jgi:hypothetical protein
MPEPDSGRRDVRANRSQVFAAADRALKAGRRPTQDGVRNALGGGSLTSINAYLNEWYADLGARLARAEQPVGGVPPEANELLQQLWWLALKGRSAGAVSGGESEEVRMMRAQRDAAMAQSSALQTLNGELTRARANAERALADTRALLMRREAALEEERAVRLQIDQELASLRMEIEVASARREAGRSKGRDLRSPKTTGVGKRKNKNTRKSTNKTAKQAKSAGVSGSRAGQRLRQSGTRRKKVSRMAGRRKVALQRKGRRR